MNGIFDLCKDVGESPIQSAQILRACGKDYIQLTTIFLYFNYNLTFNAPKT